jgi:hypothetical protein
MPDTLGQVPVCVKAYLWSAEGALTRRVRR